MNLKFYSAVTLILISVFIILISPSHARAPKPIVYVDPEDFSGLWYEVARTYNYFEEECIAPTVEYSLIENEKYQVINRCFKNSLNGELIEYKGIASSLFKGNMSQIKKTYFWVFSKNYRIIYLDDNYQTAILSDEKLENLWIMNRKPQIQESKLKNIVSLLDKYMDTSKLIYPKQDKNGRYK